jgi:hypothetical protein
MLRTILIAISTASVGGLVAADLAMKEHASSVGAAEPLARVAVVSDLMMSDDLALDGLVPMEDLGDVEYGQHGEIISAEIPGEPPSAPAPMI